MYMPSAGSRSFAQVHVGELRVVGDPRVVGGFKVVEGHGRVISAED